MHSFISSGVIDVFWTHLFHPQNLSAYCSHLSAVLHSIVPLNLHKIYRIVSNTSVEEDGLHPHRVCGEDKMGSCQMSEIVG
jgi:hypothetical protein